MTGDEVYAEICGIYDEMLKKLTENTVKTYGRKDDGNAQAALRNKNG